MQSAFFRHWRDGWGNSGWELSKAKTRIITFHRDPPTGGNRFEFLGFEFYWGKDRKGKPHLKRRTSRGRLEGSLKRLTQLCRKSRNLELRVLFQKLNAKLRGYYNYYGIVGNYESLEQFFHRGLRILYKWLNRRCQKRSYNWEGFTALLTHYQLEKPRIVWS